MHPVFEIASSSYSTYHLFFIVSITFVVATFFIFNSRFASLFDKVYFISICFIGGIIGSKLFYFLEDTSISFYKVIDFDNGFVFYGGLFGVILAIILQNINNLKNLRIDLDSLAFASCLGMFMGKLGCFFAGCCYGYPTRSFIGVFFDNQNTSAFNLLPLFPIQIIDSLLNLVLFLVLILMYRRKKYQTGNVFIFYVILYSIIRFVTEFFRADYSRGFVMNDMISLSQLYSILMIVIGSLVIVLIKKRFINEI